MQFLRLTALASVALLLHTTVPCAAVASAAAPLPGDPRAWSLLEKMAAWSDSLTSPRTPCWFEWRMQAGCTNVPGGRSNYRVRFARAGDGRVAWDVSLEPQPSGVRIRFDGHRYMEYSLASRICRVVDTYGPIQQKEGVHAPAALGAALVEGPAFLLYVAMGVAFGITVSRHHDGSARTMGAEDIVADGRTHHCEIVRHGRISKGFTDYWIDTETGCPWRFVDVDSNGTRRPETQAQYSFVRDQAPPDSCFDTAPPKGARLITGPLESAKPQPQGGPPGAPRLSADSMITFRWRGPAHSVAVVGPFNCWDPQADLMKRQADGSWTLTRHFGVTPMMDYLFLVDASRYETDPLNPAVRSDGFGGWMSCLWQEREESGRGAPNGQARHVPPIDTLPPYGTYVDVDEFPRVVKKTAPHDPADARGVGMHGTVMVMVLVGSDGRVRDTRVPHSVPGLDAAATDCARQWIFRPASKGGRPVAVWLAIPIVFAP